ncbi:MAG: cupin domain-containing protein [Clostridiales bacterium]|nr:cupin domain-containing protein [Clostridiales bacterium]
MIRRQGQFLDQVETNLKGGSGEIMLRNLLLPDEMHGAARFCGITTIPPGASIGKHKHVNDFELYYIIDGIAEVNDNGIIDTVQAGEITCCRDGDFHAIRNIGNTNLVYLSVIFLKRD